MATVTAPRWGGRRAQALTAQVLERDGWRCVWCGGPADTADHLTARMFGGADDLANLAAACRPCNSRRGAVQRALAAGHRLHTAMPPSRRW